MDRQHPHPGTPSASQTLRKGPSRTGHVDSASLFDGSRELVIAHNDDTYYLRITRNEKLILTK